jgi:hypothetical protein
MRWARRLLLYVVRKLLLYEMRGMAAGREWKKEREGISI